MPHKETLFPYKIYFELQSSFYKKLHTENGSKFFRCFSFLKSFEILTKEFKSIINLIRVFIGHCGSILDLWLQLNISKMILHIILWDFELRNLKKVDFQYTFCYFVSSLLWNVLLQKYCDIWCIYAIFLKSLVTSCRKRSVTAL